MDFLNTPDNSEQINYESDNEENINNNVVNQEIPVNDRYVEIIKLMGLNENINYPINIIFNGIVELNTINNNANSNKYQRNIHFRSDLVSEKIFKHLFGTSHIHPVSHVNIVRTLKRLQRQYKYNTVIKTDNNNIVCKNTNTLGFNYDNLRWVQLESYIIE